VLNLKNDDLRIISSPEYVFLGTMNRLIREISTRSTPITCLETTDRNNFLFTKQTATNRPVRFMVERTFKVQDTKTLCRFKQDVLEPIPNCNKKGTTIFTSSNVFVQTVF